jgi:predicted GIY-YIG superfamily endonuclease
MQRFKILKGKGYDWSTYIYLLEDFNGCKFGITNNIERRKKQHLKTRPELKLMYYKVFENRNIARLIEMKMKIQFPIIKGFGIETTSATIEELINFIESSNICLEKAILELPKHLQPI